MKKTALITGMLITALTGAPAYAEMSDIHDEGVGMYTDASTANQLSTFTINNGVVSCGVGTLAANVFSGPFAMLMYSKHISSYVVNPVAGTINATGKMRSITKVAGIVVEDVLHDFLAIAVDNVSGGSDRFDTHFKTDFWNVTNPMCTASDKIIGGCRFGGKVLLGEVDAHQ